MPATTTKDLYPPELVAPDISVGTGKPLKPVAPLSGPRVHTIKSRRRPTTIRDLLTDRIRMEKFLDYMRLGANWTSAGAAIKVSPHILTRWMDRGSRDKYGPYHSFYKQAMSALGEATAIAEIDVKRSSPLIWLKNGPGRFINPDWSEADSQGAVMGIPQSTALPMTKETFVAALKELRDAGVDLNTLAMDERTLEGSFVRQDPALPAPAAPTTASPNGNPQGPSAQLPKTPPSLPEKNPVSAPPSDDDADYDPETGEFNYDEGEDSIETDGTNYAEDGNWNSTNPHIPYGTRAIEPPLVLNGGDILSPALMSPPATQAAVRSVSLDLPSLDVNLPVSISDRLARAKAALPRPNVALPTATSTSTAKVVTKPTEAKTSTAKATVKAPAKATPPSKFSGREKTPAAKPSAKKAPAKKTTKSRR